MERFQQKWENLNPQKAWLNPGMRAYNYHSSAPFMRWEIVTRETSEAQGSATLSSRSN